MDLTKHFAEKILKDVKEFPYLEVYDSILESTTYCPVQIRTMILNCIFHLEILGKFDRIGVISSYMDLFTKEKHKGKILQNHLLYVTQVCYGISVGRFSNSPTAPEGLYC